MGLGMVDGMRAGPVIVPLDGSALAERALPWGVYVASRMGAPLLLVRVVEPWVYPQPALSQVSGITVEELVVEADRHDAERYVERQRAAVRAAHPHLAVQAEVLLGDPAEQLLELETARGARLVVMTTRGRAGLERWLRGSVAEKVLRRGAAPVLLMRPWDDPARAPALARPGLRILVPLDGSPLAASAVPQASALAAAVRGALVLVTVVRPGNEPAGVVHEGPRATRRAAAQRYLDEVAAGTKGRSGCGDVRVSTVVLTADDVAGALVDHAILAEADVIAMSTHGRGGLGRLLYGSVADRVARTATVPVLLARPPAAGGLDAAAARPAAEADAATATLLPVP
jgi:nucleotide-binding universal stress UspA family protein